jgi:RNA polymerase sigma factor for flagellar operon FliA
MDWIPRRVRKMAKAIEKTREELTQELQRTPSSQEISDKLNLPVDKINEIISAAEQSQILSFEDLQSFSNRYYVPEDKVTSVQPEDAISDYERVDIKSALKMALMELSEREKLVLSLYYIEDLTLKEMKLVLNISEARISQIHTVCIKKLKEKLEELKAAKAGSELD